MIYDSNSDEEESTYKIPVLNPDEKKWDCESIISTYSNIYNHPALIKESPVCILKLLIYLYFFYFYEPVSFEQILF